MFKNQKWKPSLRVDETSIQRRHWCGVSIHAASSASLIRNLETLRWSGAVACGSEVLILEVLRHKIKKIQKAKSDFQETNAAIENPDFINILFQFFIEF